MNLLVTGSIGIDTVEAPWGKVEDALGGSSIYFAQAASFFSPVRLVGAVGDDCPASFLQPLRDNRQIDLAGLETRKGSKTFRWHGRYGEDVNQRDTISVELNVLAEASTPIPQSFRDSDFVFLANTHPELQMGLLRQLDGPKFVVADSMDLWIESQRQGLIDLIGGIDGFVLTDSEARQLTGKKNTIEAGLEIANWVGCRRKRPSKDHGLLIVKKGEHGSLMFLAGGVTALPGYPSRRVVDPTGAGDSFAGAMMGYLASAGRITPARLRKAVAYGTVTASFTLEDFSLKRLFALSRQEIDERLLEFQRMLRV